jgi:hypothetical protein
MWRLEDNVRKFDLKISLEIAFLPKDDQSELTPNNFAIKETTSAWETKVTSIVWHMRWTQKGLQPIKPAVHVKTAFSVGGGQACRLA